MQVLYEPDSFPSSLWSTQKDAPVLCVWREGVTEGLLGVEEPGLGLSLGGDEVEEMAKI